MTPLGLAGMVKLRDAVGWKSFKDSPPELGKLVYLRGSDFMGYWYTEKVQAVIKGDKALQRKLSRKPFVLRVKWTDENGNPYEIGDRPDDWIPAEAIQ